MRTFCLKAAFVVCIAVVCVFCILPAQRVLAGPVAYIGIFADETHYMYYAQLESPFTLFEAWVWVLPGDNGMMCAEFMVGRPAWLASTLTTLNPDYSVFLGEPFTGITLCFETCQEDWTWICKFQLLPYRTDLSGYLTIEPHPDWGAYDIANCLEGYPLEPVHKLNDLELRDTGKTYLPPLLSEIAYPDFTTLIATFDQYVETVGQDHTDNFRLYNIADPSESIVIENAMEFTPENVGRFYLVLADAMVPGTTYMLEANWFCDGPNGCADSEMSFFFDEPVATMLQSFAASLVAGNIELSWQLSSIDQDVEFVVFRQEGEGAFVEIERGLEGSGALSFEYIDDTALPGCSYKYRVEYILDGESHVLFITEPVETPGVALSLEQNHPNPFNPSTTVSYNLPAAGYVSCEIFDVTGRRVRTLISNVQTSGSHRIKWNGLNNTGERVVSGVYFYRLHAGKEELTRKMVLMR